MPDCSSESGVEALDGVGGVDDAPQLRGELQERHELVPVPRSPSGSRAIRWSTRGPRLVVQPVELSLELSACG